MCYHYATAYSKKDKQTSATFRTKEEFDVVNLDIYKKVEIPFVITDNGTKIFCNLPNIPKNINKEKYYFVEDIEWQQYIENQKNNNLAQLERLQNELFNNIKVADIEVVTKNNIYI